MLLIENIIIWVKWSDLWPSMVTHTRNLCSAFNPSKCTHSSEHTHTQWTHTRSSGQPYCCSWGFGALLKGLTSVVVLKVEEIAGYSLPPPTIPAGPETQTHDLQATSPTLYPLGHDCPTKVYNQYKINKYRLNIKLHLFPHSLICSRILPQLNILYFLDFHL